MNTPIADTPFNPYCPPESGPQDAELSPDTEFMVSSECILCGPEVRLPEVCIRTGDRGELQRLSDELRWTPTWLHRIRVILLAMGLPVAVQLLVIRATQPIQSTPQITWMSALVFVFVCIVLPAVLWVAARATSRIQVTWYVETDVIRRHRRKQKTWMFIACVLGGMSVASVLLTLVESESFFLFTFWTGLPAVISLGWSRQLIQPHVIGTHQGLHILAGFNPLFLQEVLSIIDRQGEDTK
ncbi:MAG: hypothetical protein GY903_16640 [Fuerstiella sp.]|nr:hypothetical protein [Fuerstiella sp.]